MRPAIALPVYTGSSSRASCRAAIEIASPTAWLSLPYPGGNTVSHTWTSSASNVSEQPIRAPISVARFAIRTRW